jgi:hypothetical protein
MNEDVPTIEIKKQEETNESFNLYVHKFIS